MNPRYGDLDPYWMAASAIDEAVRNCVAVGADPRRIAILDNFCWGNTDRPETLGSLVRAALACYDVATALGTPFISGKDSLNNEFRPKDAEPIAIPPSLLDQRPGPDRRREPVRDHGPEGAGQLPVPGRPDAGRAGRLALRPGRCAHPAAQVPAGRCRSRPGRCFAAVHRAIDAGLVRACHDLSEGGLAVAAAEMAFAGGLRRDGSRWATCRARATLPTAALLLAESNTRFLCEVRPRATPPRSRRRWPASLTPASAKFIDDGKLEILGEAATIAAELAALKEAWQKPLRW